MAFQILPGSSRSADIGSSLATGLGGLLSNLAQKKAQQMQQVQSFQQFQNAGLTPEDARLISYFSGAPEIQAKLLSSLFERGGNPQQSALDMQSAMQELPNATQQPQQMAPQGGLQALSQLQPGMLGGGLQALMPQLQAMQSQQAQPQLGQQQAPVFGQPQGQQPQAQQPGASGFYRPPRREVREEEKLALQKQKLALQERQITGKEQAVIDKETLPVYHEIIKGSKNAEENDRRLDRMEQLVEKGNLGSPLLNSAFKTITNGIFGLGIDLTSLLTADAQEFDKLSSEFAKGAKEVFPGRVTDADLKAYMRSVPNLTQSGAGIRRVITSWRAANDAAKLRKNVMQQIIEENGGRRPANLEILIEQKAGPQLDQLSKEFINAPLVGERFGGGIIRY